MSDLDFINLALRQQQAARRQQPPPAPRRKWHGLHRLKPHVQAELQRLHWLNESNAANFLGGGGATGFGSNLTTNLNAYWTLNEASGNRADSTGHGLAQVQVGSVTGASGFGNVGNVSVWNASVSNYLHVGSLFSSGDWTVAGWFNCDYTSGNVTLWAQSASGGNSNQWLYVDGNGKVNFKINQTVTDQGGTAVSKNTWYWIGVTYQASTNQIKCYLNGGTITEFSSTHAASYTGNNDFELGIAVSSGSKVNPLNGKLVGWGQWTQVLTSQGLSNLYNNGNGQAFSSLSGLAA